MKHTVIGLLVGLAVLCGAATLPYLNVAEKPSAPGYSAAPKTVLDPWFMMRLLSASDTALTSSTRIWGNANAIFHALNENWNTVSISCVAYGDGDGAGDPASGSFSWTAYACRRWGPPEIVATGTWAIGAMECSHNPATGITVGTDAHFSTADQTNYKWGELPVITTEYWATDVKESGTTDQVGQLSFDPIGCWGLYIEATSVTSLTTLYFFVTGR